MISVSALKSNYTQARLICQDFNNVLKYLLLLYSSSKRISKLFSNTYVIKFVFRSEGEKKEIKLALRNNSGSDAFIFSEVFLNNYYNIDLENEPKTILDLGGNIGLSSIFFKKKYKSAEVVAVEPMPNNIDIFRQNIALNNLDITLLPVAAAIEDGSVDIQQTELDYDHHIVLAENRTEQDNSVTVEALTIPSIMKKLGWKKIDLLKMDIEGYEKVLLTRNADWLKKVEAMCIEIHDDYTINDLAILSEKYEFEYPIELPGGLFFMKKKHALQANGEIN